MAVHVCLYVHYFEYVLYFYMFKSLCPFARMFARFTYTDTIYFQPNICLYITLHQNKPMCMC